VRPPFPVNASDEGAEVVSSKRTVTEDDAQTFAEPWGAPGGTRCRKSQLVLAGQFPNHLRASMNQTLIIVPTVNERENLPRLAQKLLSLPQPVDLLVVDGNSTDGTSEIADELAAQHPEIHVLHETKKNGLGPAYTAGFKWALERDYDFIFEMDCDFSHNPDDVPAFLEAAKNENADLVLGSRYSGGVRVVNWPLKRLMLSRSAGIYVRVITGMPFTDPTGGYKCFRRRALQALDLDKVHSNGYSFQIEMTHRLWRRGFKIVEVPIVFTDRIEGHSKMSRRIVREALVMVWRLWLQNGLRRHPKKRH
jgi:dolichol-phosphate mannosyltransferase